MVKKYPIGTKIRYNGYCYLCKDKIGKVVGGTKYICYLSLPESGCNIKHNQRIPCSWDSIELLVKKNQQLLFSFMEKDA